MENIFTRHLAREYAKENKIEEWIHKFLQAEGNNIPLSDGLRIVKRIYIGPVTMPLSLFIRCCGPEKDKKYKVDSDGFEERVSKISSRIQSGWDMPPLIVNFTNNSFELNDGNHRYEALVRSGIKEWDVIIWITGQDDYEQFMRSYSEYFRD